MPASARLLFLDLAEAAAGRQVPAHRHAFWQVEVLAAGSARVRVAGAEHALGVHEALVIPPGVEHAFAYPSAGARWVSAKFAAEGVEAGPARIERGPKAAALGRALLVLADSAPPATGREAIGHLLLALLALRSTAHGREPLAARVRALVLAHPGRPWSAREAARALGMTADRASAVLRREGGVGLKATLDRCRAERAAELLAWSDQPVGAVGARLGFADVFAFSRFFARVHGVSPTAFRARCATASRGR